MIETLYNNGSAPEVQYEELEAHLEQYDDAAALSREFEPSYARTKDCELRVATDSFAFYLSPKQAHIIPLHYLASRDEDAWEEDAWIQDFEGNDEGATPLDREVYTHIRGYYSDDFSLDAKASGTARIARATDREEEA